MSNLNNSNYTLWHGSKSAERILAGFVGGNRSTDGNWIIGDKGDNKNFDSATTGAVRLSYMAEGKFLNLPNLTNEEAIELSLIMASSVGASDGYTWNEPLQ